MGTNHLHHKTLQPYPQKIWLLFYLCPREESDLYQDLRRVLLYPLSYKGLCAYSFNALILNEK
jgi:hypothetical protein